MLMVSSVTCVSTQYKKDRMILEVYQLTQLHEHDDNTALGLIAKEHHNIKSPDNHGPIRCIDRLYLRGQEPDDG